MVFGSRQAGPGQRVFRLMSPSLPELNFVTLHYACFIAVWFSSSLIFWGAATPFGSVTFTDAIYMGVSAMSGAGMNTMNISSLNTFQQIVLWLDMIIGSPIVASGIVVWIRRRTFEKIFSQELEKKNQVGSGIATDPVTNNPVLEDNSKSNSVRFTEANSGQNSASTSFARQGQLERPPLSGRHSKFSTLSRTEKLQMGGREYNAVCFLSWVVPLYVVAWQLLGSISMGACISVYYSDAAKVNEQNPWWVGAFNAVSAFNNSGLSPLDANMTIFNHSVFILLSMGSFIIAGNTGYPIIIRCFVWILHKCLPNNETWSESKATLKFLLDHPRRCYTNMFPSRHTWWLFGALMTLTAIGTLMFVILNIGNDAVTGTFSPGIEFVVALFQSASTRTGGFVIISMTSVRVSLLVVYVILMYTSAYPVAISIRNSNVYEERSLGIYSDDPTYEDYEQSRPENILTKFEKKIKSQIPTHAQRWFFFQEQMRAQLAHDIWLLATAVFMITAIEVSQYERDPVTYSVFNIIFEVVSVGLTTGLPDHAYCFSGGWHKASKLVLAFVMLQGRHRGLPVAIDKAVLLPGHSVQQLEEEDARIHAGLQRIDDEKLV